jgi:hypothetical protein
MIFGYLKFEDLCRITRVCKRWHRLSSRDSIWKELYSLHYDEPNDNSMTYKSLYFKKQNRIFLPGSGNSISLLLDRDVFISSVATPLSGRIILRYYYLFEQILIFSRLKAPTHVYGLYLTLKGSEVGYKPRGDGKFELASHHYFNHHKAIRGNAPWQRNDSFVMEAGNYSIPFTYAFPLYGDNGEQLQVTRYQKLPLIPSLHFIRMVDKRLSTL